MSAVGAPRGRPRIREVRRWPRLLLLLTVWSLTVVVPVASARHLPMALAQDTRPVIQVRPNPLLDSRDARVFGRDFCPDAGCSPVDVTLAGRLVADDVAVQADGTFAVDVVVRTMPGEHELIATQQLADGSMQSARDTVIVPARDYVDDTPSAEEGGPPGGAAPAQDDGPASAATGPAAGDEQAGGTARDAAARSTTAMEPSSTVDRGGWWAVSAAALLAAVVGYLLWRWAS